MEFRLRLFRKTCKSIMLIRFDQTIIWKSKYINNLNPYVFTGFHYDWLHKILKNYNANTMRIIFFYKFIIYGKISQFNTWNRIKQDSLFSPYLVSRHKTGFQ